MIYYVGLSSSVGIVSFVYTPGLDNDTNRYENDCKIQTNKLLIITNILSIIFITIIFNPTCINIKNKNPVIKHPSNNNNTKNEWNIQI